MKDITSLAPAAICEVTAGGISRNLLINRDSPPFNDPAASCFFVPDAGRAGTDRRCPRLFGPAVSDEPRVADRGPRKRRSVVPIYRDRPLEGSQAPQKVALSLLGRRLRALAGIDRRHQAR